MLRLQILLPAFISIMSFLSCQQSEDFENEFQRAQLKNYRKPLSKIIDSKKNIQIIVYKSEFTLEVLQNGKILKQYPIVLGKNPTDDKRMEGDFCTPEGTFRMRDKYPHKRWSKFVWLNYPTKESYKNHNRAKSQGQIPQDATVGSEIGIHGVPEGKNQWIDNLENWTWGCISMKNNDLDEIYPYINSSTPITIKQ